MLNFKPVELSDREILEPFLRNVPYPNCDFSFTNIYMWRKKYQTAYAIEGDTLYLMSNGNAFLMPIGGDLKQGLETMMAYAEEKNIPFTVAAVTREGEAQLEECMPGKFTVEYDRDYCDYIYATQRLQKLAGKKLHSKRNHINKFNATYELQYETITDDNLQEVLDMHRAWCKANDCSDDEDLLEESCAVRDVLRHLHELPLQGGLIRANGRVVGFSLGQPINDKVFDVCIEKAFYDVNGAYTVINQQFALHECEGYEYMNREEDLGIPGLRKAKESYYPDILLEKGVAHLR